MFFFIFLPFQRNQNQKFFIKGLASDDTNSTNNI